LKNWQVPEPGRQGAQAELAVLSKLHSVVEFFPPKNFEIYTASVCQLLFLANSGQDTLSLLA